MTAAGATWLLQADGRESRVAAPVTPADRDAVLALAASLASPLPGGFPGLPAMSTTAAAVSPAAARPTAVARPTREASTTARTASTEAASRTSADSPPTGAASLPTALAPTPATSPPTASSDPAPPDPTSPPTDPPDPAEAELPDAVTLAPPPPAQPAPVAWAEVAGGVALRSGVAAAPMARIGAWWGGTVRGGLLVDLGAPTSVTAWPDVATGRTAAGLGLAWGGTTAVSARAGVAAHHFTAADVPDRWAFAPTVATGVRVGLPVGPVVVATAVEAGADLSLLTLTRDGDAVTTLSPVALSALLTVSAPLTEPRGPRAALPP